jgi:hypothetical protein
MQSGEMDGDGERMSATFGTSDLNRRSREVLDAARAGEARLRDGDGLGLLLLPERRVQALRLVAAAAANLALVETALATSEPRSPDDYGDWTWLRHLPAEDLPAFIAELRAAMVAAARAEQTDALEEALDAWQASAAALADPDSRAILLGGASDDDFIEVGRPGDETADTGSPGENPSPL